MSKGAYVLYRWEAKKQTKAEIRRLSFDEFLNNIPLTKEATNETIDTISNTRSWDRKMDLQQNTNENIKFLVSEIVTKLKMVNVEAIKLESLSDERYEDLVDIYHLVQSKNQFSPNEMQALVEELGNLRK